VNREEKGNVTFMTVNDNTALKGTIVAGQSGGWVSKGGVWVCEGLMKAGGEGEAGEARIQCKTLKTTNARQSSLQC
jgi:hypothetical protein